MTFTASELLRTDATRERLEELEAGAQHAVSFGFDGTIARVRFADEGAAHLYRRRYRHMPAYGEASLTTFVAERAGVSYFWIPGGSAYRWDRHLLAPYELVFLADAVATTHVFQSLEATAVLHAGAVAGRHGVAAIVGTSESGKTTTALACVRRGLELYSDEFCVVAPRGVVPFPRTLNLRAGGIELLAADEPPASPLDAWLATHRGADRADVGFDELLGTWNPPEPRPLQAVFFVCGRGSEPEARTSTGARMLPKLLPWTRMKPRGVEAAQLLLGYLHGARCFELVLGTPDATASLIARTLATAP